MNEVVSIVGVVWIVYGRAIDWGMVVDDVVRWKFINSDKVKNRKKIRFLWLLDRIKYSFTFRNIKLDRMLSITIHSIVCVLIWVVFGMDRTAYWTALLFAIHPVSLSVATWLNG